MGKDASEIRQDIEETRARMGDTVEALSYKADVPARMKGAVNDRVETVKETIRDVVSNVKDAVGGVKQRAAESWSETADRGVPSGADVKKGARRAIGIVAENPLGLAIGAAAVGFLAGLLMPVTDYEREKLGPARDDLVDRAQSAGAGMVEHGKQVLKETAEAALQTAQQSAQTHAQQIASEALHPSGEHIDNAITPSRGETGSARTASP
jgi:ElaB/YqjD/DUF883 family membrane-anchored ribosome-binding protein